MTTPSVRSVEAPECQSLSILRRRLLARYLSDAFAAADIPDQAVAEAFEPGHPFRSWVRQQGIDPDTLTAFTRPGVAFLRAALVA
jgi:hypothetical protein